MPADDEHAPPGTAPGPGSRSAVNRGVLYALISGAGFGFLGVLGTVGRAHGFTNSTLLAWRFMGAAVILGGIYWWRVGVPRFEKAPFLLGLVGYSLQSLLFFKTVEQIGPGKAAILLYTYPTLIALVNWLHYKQRPTRAHFLVLAVTTVGCLLVLYSNQGEFSPVGVVLGFTTALVYSLYLVASEQVLKNIDAMASSFHVALGTGISMTILSVLTPSRGFPTTSVHWVVIAGLIVLCTVLPTLALFSAIRRIGSARAALCSTIEPMVAVALGALFFAEDFAPHQILGGAMVVSSITIIYLSGSHSSRNPAPDPIPT